jgi:hypothetical protein
MMTAMTDDLVAFLRARIDDDDVAARRVKGAWREVPGTGVILASDGHLAEPCAEAHWAGVGAHIVRWDPNRVLAETDAKRRVLAMHDEMAQDATAEDFLVRDPAQMVLRILAPVLRLLALPYAGHPDYREEWRP